TVLESGNKTTSLFTDLVTTGGGPPPPNPPRNPALGTAPAGGVLVQFKPTKRGGGGGGGDNLGRNGQLPLPPQHPFLIHPTGTPSLIRTASGVGTILFDVAVHPTTGELWVANTDARNVVRFEPNLRGHLVQTRITRVNPSTGAVVGVNDLNPNINYSVSPG